MKITNINGTSDNKCACGSWLKHWEKFSRQKASWCPVIECFKQDLVGAHVQVDNGADDTWYIYPLCSAHNQSPATLDVSDAYTLVPANRRDTCER